MISSYPYRLYVNFEWYEELKTFCDPGSISSQFQQECMEMKAVPKRRQEDGFIVQFQMFNDWRLYG